MDAPVTLEEKQLFHSIDRELYYRLVINLNWAIPQARQVIALWLWLEEMGFPNIIIKILSLSNTVLRYVIDEAMICLHCIKTGNIPPPPNCDIPLTMNLMGKDISLQFFHHHKETAMEGMIRIMQNIFSRVFEDIEQQLSFSNAPQPVIPLDWTPPMSKVTYICGGTTTTIPMMIRPNGEGSSRTAVLVDARQTQMIQGPVSSLPQVNLNVNARPWNERVPESERTMFMTFSRGYPLSEEEVRDFLTGMFGDCIESITMQKVTSPNEEPLYAHVIFKLASTVTLLLDGMGKAKFLYNGKHIWVRRWEKRDQLRFNT